MRGNTESKRRRSRVSSVESFSEKEITKQLRRDAMRHPATLIPLGLCILFIILAFTVLGPLLAIFLIIGSGVAATGAFFWRYSIRYNEEYTKRAQELMQQHDRETRDREQGDLEQSREDLQTGFSRVNSVEGLKALQELVHEYEQLQPVLGRGKETDPLAIAHIPALAEETYRRGLSVLAGCVDLMREIHSPNNEKLGEEAGELEREIEALKSDETQAERLKILETTLASHKERLDLVKEQRLRVDGLLQQSDSCEASLHRTRIELAALKADNVDASVNSVTQALQKTITQAKEVQEELKKLGY